MAASNWWEKLIIDFPITPTFVESVSSKKQIAFCARKEFQFLSFYQNQIRPLHRLRPNYKQDKIITFIK